MFKLFDKLDKFIKDAEAQVKSAAKKGADVLRGIADWLESQAAPVVMGAKAKPSEFDTADEDLLGTYCDKLKKVSDDLAERKPVVKGAKGAVGPGLAILLQIIMAALQALLAKKEAEKKLAAESPAEDSE